MTASADAEDGYAPTERVPPPAHAPPPASAAPAQASPAERNALPAGTLVGEFELVGVIGVGGFGIVYRAWDRSLKRAVAIKEYLPSSLAQRGEDMQVRLRTAADRDTFTAGLHSFVKEAQMLAQFDHPSLVKVYRFWEGNGSAYMVMPLYDGRTLRDELRRRGGQIDEPTLLGWLGPVADALAVVHAESCYHRDIAPDNVMLLNGSDRPLLLDFGAARRVIGDMTQALTAILKPGYAPIEQYGEVPGLKQGPWTDIYALAGVAHYALRGRTPPPSVGRLINDQYQPLSGSPLEAQFSHRLLAAIDHALAVRPQDRTASIAQFKAELGLAPPPVVAATGEPAAPAPAADPAPPTTDIDVTEFGQPSNATTAAPPGHAPTERVARDAEYAPTQRVERAPAFAATQRVAPAYAPTERMAHDTGFAPTMRVAPPAAPSAAPAFAAAAPGGAAVAAPAAAPLAAGGARRWIGIGAAALVVVAAGAYLGLREGAPAPSVATAPAPTSPAPVAPATTQAPAPAPMPVAAPPAAAPDIDADFARVVGSQTPGWGLDIKLDHAQLRIGRDRLAFTLRSLQDGYVYVYTHGSDGTLQQLYPNALTAPPRIAKGGTLRLPQGNLEFNVDGPAGNAQILVMVSRWPREHHAYAPRVANGFTSYPTGAEAARLAAASPGPLPLIAGAAECAAGCRDEFGAAIAAFEVVR